MQPIIFQIHCNLGMVDDFQKKYQALDIPYPKDTLTGSIDAQAKEQKAAYEKFVAESKDRIVGIGAEQAKWEAMMPLEEMNMEEAMEAMPDRVINPMKKPTFWPHDYDMDEWNKYYAKVKADFDKDPDSFH